MIRFENINKIYNKNHVLNNVSLNIDKGDVVAVLGPSGSGKTTMLRCMNFLEKADTGTMTFDEKKYDLHTVSKKDMANIRKKTGFVFQNYNLFLNKTALQNVTEGLTIARRMNKNEADVKAKAALDKVGLSDRYDFYPSQLSGGQQQRVGIARALVTDPEIIYFDEPTSALDPELIGEVLAVMKNLANDGITMIVVTHELSFARDVSNRVVFMENGEILKDVPSKEFFEDPGDVRIRNFLSSLSS